MEKDEIKTLHRATEAKTFMGGYPNLLYSYLLVVRCPKPLAKDLALIHAALHLSNSPKLGRVMLEDLLSQGEESETHARMEEFRSDLLNPFPRGRIISVNSNGNLDQASSTVTENTAPC